MEHNKLHLLRQKAKEANREQYLARSKERLIKIIETKLRTSFIGSLHAFEQTFGFLWGVNKQPEERTEEEKYFFDLWTKARNDVLNNGNNQIRAARNEIENHTVNWNRYSIQMGVKNEKDV